MTQGSTLSISESGNSFYVSTNSQASSLSETAEKIFWLVTGLFVNPLADLFIQALADALCLETLTHGTSWKNYAKIRTKGIDPQTKEGGFCQGLVPKDELTRKKLEAYRKNSQGYFFVQQDSNFGRDLEGNFVNIFEHFDVNGIENLGMGVRTTNPPAACEKIKQELFLHTISRFYALKAGAAEWAKPEDESVSASVGRAFGSFINLFAPTLKVRFLPEEIKSQFQDDPLLLGSSIRTAKPIHADHLGLKGVFIQGVRGNLGERITQNPSRCLWGVIRLINPIGVLLIITFGIYYAAHSCCPLAEPHTIKPLKSK